MPKKSKGLPKDFLENRLDGKTAIVTGSNTGIGKETAKQLAIAGARVILACRSRERGEAARDDIIKDTGSENVVFMSLDLSSLRNVKQFAEKFIENEDRLDLLINNAGLVGKDRQETEDGIERTFAVNHLGHFYLTNLLLDKLKACAPSRVIILTSILHRTAKWVPTDPDYKRNFSGLYAYGRTKVANILHCTQLAKQLKDTGVTVYAVHPGAILDTDIARDFGRSNLKIRFLFAMVAVLYNDKKISIEEGALTTLYCCMEPSIANDSGRFYTKCKETPAASHATKPELAQKLWDVSLQMCSQVSD